MGYQIRRRTGPLTPIQRDSLTSLSEGLRGRQIANSLSRSESYISDELNLAAAKLGALTTTHAACMLATHKAYLEAATLLEEQSAWDEDGKVSEVLRELAGILRTRAAALVPA
jgi:DNA-binding CsgD family transcriptional regulator